MQRMRVGNQHALSLIVVGPAGVEQRGLELLLTAHGMWVGASADEPHEAVEALRRVPCDLVLLNLALGEDARQTVLRLQETAPSLPILGYGDRRAWPLRDLLNAGMRGFALTVGTPEHFLHAIRTVASGASYLDPDFVISGECEDACREKLSERERQVLGLLAHGLNGREVATRLCLSPATVRTHVQNAMHKLGARTRAQAIVMATGEDPESQPENIVLMDSGRLIA